MNKSKLIILDEPTNGLDPEGIIELRDIIHKLNIDHGITFLISSHYLTELEHIASRLGIIKEGKMLMEETMDTLQLQCNSSLKVTTENQLDEDITRYISESFTDYNPLFSDNAISFYKKQPEVDKIFSVLSSKGIVIKDINKEVESLEELFISGWAILNRTQP